MCATAETANLLCAGDRRAQDRTEAFTATSRGLRLIGTAGSGGTDPNSVTIAGDLVDVLNAGSETIAGFRLGRGGLRPIPGSARRELNHPAARTLVREAGIFPPPGV